MRRFTGQSYDDVHVHSNETVLSAYLAFGAYEEATAGRSIEFPNQGGLYEKFSPARTMRCGFPPELKLSM